MRRAITSGKCVYCSQSFAGSAMGRHLESCKSRQADIRAGSTAGSGAAVGSGADNSAGQDPHGVDYLLKVTPRYTSEYWLFVEANGASRLKDLDTFLRGIWLECCGHLSCFTIAYQTYEAGRGMNVTLYGLLEQGMSFGYEYDYGSTTELVIRVVSTRPARTRKKGEGPLLLVARNDPVSFECASCKKVQATDICSVCFWEGPEATFCKRCLKHHKCGEDMALPIVNSPRTGVCGYTG